MVVFYANENFEDIGVLKSFKLDLKVSSTKGDNDFEASMNIENDLLAEGYYIYVENEEYGGIVDSVRINTKNNTVYYTGRTWRGILESKIIEPPTNADYYTVTGNISTIINNLINNFGLSSLFSVNINQSAPSVSNYKFYRYTDLYSGVIRLLSENQYKLVARMDAVTKKCVLFVVPIVDYSDSTELSSDLFNFDITRIGGTVNHLIGLGAGELKDRLVVHMYADENGNISDTQTFTGDDEIVDIYDYGSAEDEQDLRTNMIERFRSLIASDKITVTLNNIEADVGDKLTAYEEYTGISAVQYIQSKIVVIDDNSTNIQYTAKIETVQTGESKGSGGGGGGGGTDDYSDLINKPSINGVTLIGNKTSSDLGLSADKYFVYNQESPSTTWTVQHNLNKNPSVTIVDSAGTAVVGAYEYVDNNTVIIRFDGNAGFSGKAYLN